MGEKDRIIASSKAMENTMIELTYIYRGAKYTKVVKR